ncbi:hypothetical protein ABIA69_002190 [Lysinibacillus parviboronicapiens]|uniref:F5/8 type C domain-containing protein n=1 Tax=Lysinibacillus parviboronicapiens TaxID=436516 RepID=A0ABV2PJC3_9BACI
MAVSVINSKWITSNDYTVANGALRSDSTIGYRSLGEGKFYFEIKNGSGSSNRWIGFTDKDNPSWSGASSMLGTMIAIWQPVVNAIYGIHLDLTSATQGRFRWNANGGSFSSWTSIKDNPQNVITKIKPVIGSAASVNTNVSTSINAGQAPFFNNIDKLLEDSEFEGTYFFDGSGSFATSKTLLSAKGKYYSILNIDTWYETKMTSNTTPAPLVANAASEFNTTYPAWKAFNGTKDNGSYDYWSSATGTTSWIQINYGKRVHVNVLELSATMLTQAVANGMPRDFNILASNDNSKFTKLAEYKGQTWSNGETKEYSFNNISEYQYYRIEVLSTNGYGYVCIGEILFKSVQNKIIEMSEINIENLIKYGMSNNVKLDSIFNNKNYILQDSVSENSDGLWVTQLDRKPLSIGFN